MSNKDRQITFENVSKFYGEVLGVNRVNLTIPPGITSFPEASMVRSAGIERLLPTV